MGCGKENVEKLLLLCVFMMMFGAAISPLVMADEDELVIWFNPQGSVDVEIAPAFYDFGDITAESSGSTNGDYFVLWNNGSIFMDVQAKSNATTLNLTLDTSASPGPDEFSIEFNEANSTGFCDSSYGTEFWTMVSPSGAAGTREFDFTVHVGQISTDHPQQNTTITFQGSVA